jgi:hypothetical protein
MKRVQLVNETKIQYLQAAKEYACKKFNKLKNEYDTDLADLAARNALLETELHFVDLQSKGINKVDENDVPSCFPVELKIIYLQMHDMYDQTILFNCKTNTFHVGCWNDIYVDTINNQKS